MPVRMDTGIQKIVPIFITNVTHSLLDFSENWSFDNHDISHISSDEAVASFLSEELNEVKQSNTVTHKIKGMRIMEYFALITDSPGHIFNFIVTWIFRTITIVTAFIMFHETCAIKRFFRRTAKIRRIQRYKTPLDDLDPFSGPSDARREEGQF